MAAFQEAPSSLPLPLPLPLPLTPPPLALSLDHATAQQHRPTVNSDSSGSRIDHASSAHLGLNGVANLVTAAAGAAVARGSRRKRGIRMKVGLGGGGAASASGGLSGGGGSMQQAAEVEGRGKKAAGAAAYACSQCVKQFSSPKALFGHMSCHASSVRFLGLDHRPITKLRSRPRQAALRRLPDPREHQDDSSDNDSIEAAYVAAAAGGDKKRARKKVSKRGGNGMHDHGLSNSSLIEDEKDFNVADCLVMLSSSTSTYSPPARSPHKRTPSCASAANSSQDIDHHDSEQEVDWLSLQRRATGGNTAAAPKYSCSTCKRVFKSHQALGGHRASHKKVKGCFARTSSSSSSKATLTTLGEEEEEDDDEEEEDDDDEDLDIDDVIDEEDIDEQLPPRPAAPQIRHPMGLSSLIHRSAAAGHECSVCHRVFATGQALGGHKRCHWVASTLPRSSNNNNSNSNSAGHTIHKVHKVQQSEHKQPLMLDLNLPPPDDLKASQETSASCDTTTTSNSRAFNKSKSRAWGHPHAANLLQL